MERIAIVKSVGDGFAVVEISRKSACAGCAEEKNCSACRLALAETETTAVAENSIGAKVGDRVRVEADSGRVLRYAAVVFLLPILLGAAGFWLGGLIFQADAAKYIASLIGFAAAFVIIRLTLERRAKKRYDLKITWINREAVYP